MRNLDVAVPVMLLVSSGAGFAMGLLSIRRFHAETDVHRLLAFWPVFFVVSVVMFLACALLWGWTFNSN
jgi:hypothetical protein